MATGANVLVTGGTTMRQVVAGTDLIETADFNEANQNMGFLLSGATDVTLGTYTESTTFGYDQGGSGVAAASAGSTVQDTGAGGFKDLQDDIQQLCAFLGQTLRTGVGTDVTAGDSITAATWSNLMLNVKDCWDNRFTPASRTASTDATVTRVTAWTNVLTQVTTWTFASEIDCRSFFNGGGQVGVSGSRTGGTASTQNTTWTTRLTNLSDVFLFHNGTSTGAGTNANLGFYELTTSDQQLVEYFGAASPYTTDKIRVLAKVNSITNPTVVTITMELTDGTDGTIDALPDGTLSINARRNQPDANGSAFIFDTPTDAAGAISGS